eukprot:scaffold28754_cov30-Tisochrysis_lutea.AAC.4
MAEKSISRRIVGSELKSASSVSANSASSTVRRSVTQRARRERTEWRSDVASASQPSSDESEGSASGLGARAHGSRGRRVEGVRRRRGDGESMSGGGERRAREEEREARWEACALAGWRGRRRRACECGW